MLLNTGPRVLVHDAGLAPRARRDIAAAKEAGRFDVDNVDLALMAAGGAMLGLLQLLESQPDADAAALTDQMTFSVLRMFGMTKREASQALQPPAAPSARALTGLLSRPVTAVTWHSTDRPSRHAAVHFRSCRDPLGVQSPDPNEHVTDAASRDLTCSRY